MVHCAVRRAAHPESGGHLGGLGLEAGAEGGEGLGLRTGERRSGRTAGGEQARLRVVALDSHRVQAQGSAAPGRAGRRVEG